MTGVQTCALPILSPNSINIYYSINGGMTWAMIAEKENNITSFNWTLPFITSGNCIVRVRAMDTAGNGLSTLSGEFLMDSTLPSVKVQYPNTREIWKGGIVKEILWSASDNYLSS